SSFSGAGLSSERAERPFYRKTLPLEPEGKAILQCRARPRRRRTAHALRHGSWPDRLRRHCRALISAEPLNFSRVAGGLFPLRENLGALLAHEHVLDAGGVLVEDLDDVKTERGSDNSAHLPRLQFERSFLKLLFHPSPHYISKVAALVG